MRIKHDGTLTEVHMAMYETLLSQYEAYPTEDYSMGQYDLCEAINWKLGYEAVVYIDNPSHGDHCATLGQLAKDLNRNTEIDKIVLLNNYRFRLATEEEAIKYAEKLRKEGMKKLAMSSSVLNKIKRNNQGDMTTNTFHETYVGKGD